MDAVDYLQKEFPAWTFGHYGNIRGTNDFKDCTTVVLLLNHRMSPQDSVLMYLINNDMRFDEEKYEAWIDAYTTAEYRQAIARVRAINNPNMKIVVCALEEWPLEEKYMTDSKVVRLRPSKLTIRALEVMEGASTTYFNKETLGRLLGDVLSMKQWRSIRKYAIFNGAEETSGRVHHSGRPVIWIKAKLKCP